MNEATFMLKLENILSFATGITSPPPALGFTEDSKFPTANTCANMLNIRVNHDNFSDFTRHMCYGICNTAGFGLL